MIETTIRLGAAIVCDFLALAIWNIGTRSPAQVLADIRAGVRVTATLRRGLTALVAGAVLLVLGTTAVVPAVRLPLLGLVETYAVIAALILEQLVGADLRARLFALRR